MFIRERTNLNGRRIGDNQAKAVEYGGDSLILPFPPAGKCNAVPMGLALTNSY